MHGDGVMVILGGWLVWVLVVGDLDEQGDGDGDDQGDGDGGHDLDNGHLVPRHLWEWPSSRLSGFETTRREAVSTDSLFISLLLLIFWILIDNAFQTFLMVSANAGMERIPWKSELQNDSKSCSLLIPTIILKGMFWYWYSIVFKLALY